LIDYIINLSAFSHTQNAFLKLLWCFCWQQYVKVTLKIRIGIVNSVLRTVTGVLSSVVSSLHHFLTHVIKQMRLHIK